MSVATADRWLRVFHPVTRPRLRLVCFPHAGGAASSYFSLSRDLVRAHPGIEVLCLQYPGRQDRRSEPPIAAVLDLAEAVAEALGPLTDEPLAFFGHSMGAAVAYETARLLEAADTGPKALVVSGRRAPSRWRPEFVHRRDDAGLKAELRLLSGTDTAVLDNDDVMLAVLPAIRADYRAIETYRSPDGPTLRCPVTVLTGLSDPRVSREEAEAWHRHTTGAFAMHEFSGGHFYLIEHQRAVVDRLVESVSPYLTELG